jgi:hypothetical protein
MNQDMQAHDLIGHGRILQLHRPSVWRDAGRISMSWPSSIQLVDAA